MKITLKICCCLVLSAFLATGTLACGDMDAEEANHEANNDDTNNINNESNGNNETNGNNQNNTNNENNQNNTTNENNENNEPADTIEVIGTWENQFGTVEFIEHEMWDFMHLIDFDNETRWAVTQNPADDEFHPDAYNRLVWTEIEDDVFYYCTVDFGLDTEEEARTSEATADETDLEEGCDGFAWTEMTRHEIAVAGTWETQFESTEVIDNEMWDFMHLVDFDNETRWAVTQNPDDDEWSPDTYNRLVWTEVEDDVFYYCNVDFGLDTEEEAQESEATADETDLAEGCDGFEWTEMTRQ